VMIDFRNNYIHRVFRAVDTSVEPHPFGRYVGSAYWYVSKAVFDLRHQLTVNRFGFKHAATVR